MKPKRKPWNIYFMEIAEKVSQRATCDRLHVGCILVRDKRIISTGYNGSLANTPHCQEVGCLLIDNHCQRVLHAEENNLAYAAKFGISTDGSIAYCTHHPCLRCLRLLIAAGIKKIYYKEMYRPEDIKKFQEEIMNIIPIEQIKYDQDASCPDDSDLPTNFNNI